MAQRLPNSIRDLAQHYKSGRLTPDAVAQQCERQAARFAQLNIFTHREPTLTRQHAAASSERHRNGQSLGLLDGVPIAVKDNFCVADLPTTCASKMLANFRPPYSATVYERLRSSGAMFAGKTNLDEFGMGSGTLDSTFGATRNPWLYSATDWHIAGGSSGGSAAAVAAGLCYAALGSDTGGSTRNPASYCGVVGLKPTYGLLSRHGLIALVNSMDVPGILARTVDDAAIMLAAMSGCDPLDSTTLPAGAERSSAGDIGAIDIRRLRVGIPAEYHVAGLDAEQLQTWRKVADLLEEGGAQVRPVSMPNTAASISVYTILNQCEVASNMSRYDGIEFGLRVADEEAAERSTEQLYARTRELGFNAVVKNRILSGNFYLLRRNYAKYFEQALRVRRLIAEDFRRVFEEVDVLLTPTTLSAAPQWRQFASASNRDQCAEQDFFTQPANMAGVPALALPVRLSEAGLPLSVQLMGDRCTDGRVLAVAKWIEERVRFPHRAVAEEEEEVEGGGAEMNGGKK